MLSIQIFCDLHLTSSDVSKNVTFNMVLEGTIGSPEYLLILAKFVNLAGIYLLRLTIETLKQSENYVQI